MFNVSTLIYSPHQAPGLEQLVSRMTIKQAIKNSLPSSENEPENVLEDNTEKLGLGGSNEFDEDVSILNN